ncbi:hypothetical protein [Photobacterium obscurum]|nr:hypothetical protein [Photobacterium obscurum]
MLISVLNDYLNVVAMTSTVNGIGRGMCMKQKVGLDLIEGGNLHP